ncbi:MAG: alpha/beta fold hydrolase [Sphingobium sp.]
MSDPETMTGRGNAPPGFSLPASADVILLHGFFGAPWTMRMLGRALRPGGLQPWSPWYESWAQPFDAIVDRICAVVTQRGLGRERPVHFVGHSMGGLIARAVVAKADPVKMGRMVMIGTPNAGSEIADFCQRQRMLRPILGQAAAALVTRRTLPALDDLEDPTYPVGVIAGNRPLPGPLRILPAPHDGKVSVASTHIAGEADHIVLPVSHAIMPFNRDVQRQTLRFLVDGSFAR